MGLPGLSMFHQSQSHPKRLVGRCQTASTKELEVCSPTTEVLVLLSSSKTLLISDSTRSILLKLIKVDRTQKDPTTGTGTDRSGLTIWSKFRHGSSATHYLSTPRSSTTLTTRWKPISSSTASKSSTSAWSITPSIHFISRTRSRRYTKVVNRYIWSSTLTVMCRRRKMRTSNSSLLQGSHSWTSTTWPLFRKSA